MNIAVIGTGYVGLVTGTCLAEVGHHVVCMDTAEATIDALRGGTVPIYEKRLDELVARNVQAGSLSFSTDVREAVSQAEVVFLAIGTPQMEDGSADLSMLLSAAEQVGSVMDHPLIIVQKSTCPVGTTKRVEARVRSALAARGVQIPISVVSNPEFLREGSAVQDFMNPDRVVIGADDPKSAFRVAALYEKIVAPERILFMDSASAELTKYAANAFLAMRISFMNEIANLCELVGADVEQVRQGIGMDPRIGPAFLAAGIGHGGSCFPKDVKALAITGRNHGYSLRIVEAVDAVNQVQPHRQVDKLLDYFGRTLVGRRVAVWGLAFKPGTDDMREAPSITVVKELLDYGAEVVAYDPVATPVASRSMDHRVRFISDPLACVDGADAVVLVTDWPELVTVDLTTAGRRMRQRLLFDFRNAYAPAHAAAAGFVYFGVGRSSKTEAALGAAR